MLKSIIKDEEAANIKVAHWSLPQVGENAKKIQTVEDIQENIEKLENEAYQKGYAAGMEKGIEEGREKAFEMTKHDIDKQLQKIDELLGHFNEPIAKLSGEISEQFLELIKILIKNFLSKEISENQEAMLGVIEDGLKELPISNKKKHLYLSAQDKSFIDGLKSEYKTDWTEKYGQLVIDVDPNLSRGEIFIRTGESTVDGTVDTRFQNLLNTEEG